MTDSNKGLRILVVENNSRDQYSITELLDASVIKAQLLTTADTLAKAIGLLQKDVFDIILLDLSLPDSSGIGTFIAVKQIAGKIPVIILSCITDMNIAVEAISLGAQDYHVKGDLDEKTLTKTILYSIERKHAEAALKASEQNLRYVLSSTAENFYVIDRNCYVTLINESAERNLLKSWGKPVTVGTNLLDVIPAEKEEPIRSSLEKVFDGKKVEYELHLSADGLPEWVLVNYMPVNDDSGAILGACIVTKDITVRKKAKQELEESYKAIRKLTAHLQNIREEERAHIAREIHDELGQQLTILKMDISWINKKIGIQDEPVKTRMKELLVILDETVKSVRRISSELRPSLLDDLGLIAAMEWQLTEFEKRYEIKTYFKPDNTEIKLPESMKTALFRIFQESLTNVARHSKAKKVTVTLHMKNSSIVLSVVDNGAGFDTQNAIGKKTLGILGMQERTSMIGGTYEISGNPGKGTRVVVTIPFL